MKKLLASLLAAVLLPGLAAASAEREWRFRVMLDESEVGTHVFRVLERDGERRVASDARFTVRFLFLDAYAYTHQATERWQGDCLSELDARTDDNGERVTVRTRPPGCVMSFAYWNPRMLQQTQLLNAQTGELTDVRVEPLGEETLTVRGVPLRARRYALTAERLRIDLWYTAQAEWVQLESRVAGGRRLRYLIQ
ncbi:MAG TPA: DUF6134 family protein [Burkholderiales bacterium]